jgi:putative FmdB family regulatory protein
MPTYEYACKTCGHRFEAWQKITDEPLTECPKCHHEIHRVLFPAGVVFKGSGFYSTDNRGHKSGAEIGTQSTTETASETKSEAKSESGGESTSPSKSESKSEPKPAATTSEAAKAS